MFGSIGMPELMVILIIALIFFGPGKLPELGSMLGNAIRSLKKALDDAPEEKPDTPKLDKSQGEKE